MSPATSARQAWSETRRLLCVRLDGMGDLLMTTPAIAALRRPGRHLTALVSRSGAAIARLVPDIDEILPFDAPWMKPPPPRNTDSPRSDTPSRNIESPRSDTPSRVLVDTLAEGRFDAAVIFTVYTQSPLPAAFLCHLAGVPLRLACCRENPYDLLTDWVPEREPAEIVRHEVKRQLDLVASVGASIDDERLRLHVPDRARARVSCLLAEHGIPPRRWILMHPGATAASRRYPLDLFAEAATTLAERTDRTILLAGAASDAPFVDEIRRRMRAPSLSFAGLLDLEELCALIETAPLLVCNNSVPAHIAAATGTRVVDLYALTNPQHTPWRVPSRVLSHDVPCRGCLKSTCPEGHHACLRGVPPSRVADAAQDLLRETSSLVETAY